MNNTDYIERKLQRVIYTFIVAVIIIVAAFAATIYYYETKEISRAVVGEGLFVKAFVDNSVGTAPLAVNFSSLLFNFEGTPTYHWDFGDGNTSNATSPAYTYNKPGEYTCNLTVIDIDGKNVTTSFRILVSVNQAPTVVSLVTPSFSNRPDRPIWLAKLNFIPIIGDKLLVALANSTSSLIKGNDWIYCEAQVSDPEGGEIVLYEWEIIQPSVANIGGALEWPKFYFSGENMKNFTIPMIYTFRAGAYDVKVTVTDAAGNKASSQVRFNVDYSNLEYRTWKIKNSWRSKWGPDFQYQMEPVQKILIKIWNILGPAQTAMNNMVKKILAPLPSDLRDKIYSLYYTIVWESKNSFYHKPNFNAPTVPSDPSPADNDVGVSVWTNLSWNCSDADGDALSYDIYFGRDPSPPLIKAGYDKTTYDLGEEALTSGTKYYWKIVARDDPDPGAYGGSKSVEGPIWNFTT